MINHASTDQLDEAIDRFEQNWSPKSRSEIRALLADHDLADDLTALTELIRIDIELRYKQGLSIQLEDYFDEFDALLGEPQHVAQIAFEDFRSRSVHGYPVASSRWRELPGVDQEVWYQLLSPPTAMPSPSSRQVFGKDTGMVHPRLETDSAFQSALEAIGFRLIDELGRGAFSHVYLATQNDLADRYVVLKVVQKTLAEPQSMAMLQHTNIVPIYSFHRIQSRSVICMPYAGGVTLADFLASGGTAASRGGPSLVTTVLNRVNETIVSSQHDDAPMGLTPSASAPAADDDAVLKPLQQLRSLDCNQLAIWIFQRLAAALAHSHARGVLHGDLKPANVLIRNDGEPALLDFNLAHSLDRQQIKHVGGTLPYMPPESYRALMGQSVAPHSSSDIYGLGVMLFEFVTGRLPYPSPRSSAAVDLEPAIRLRRELPDWQPQDTVTPGLRSIINRSLAYQPDDRYQSSEQLQEDLECERQSLPLSFARESRAARAQKWIRRHPRAVSGSSVALLLLALLIPVGISAKVWRDQSRHMAVTAKIKAFSEESSNVLSTMMANPQRHSDSGIVFAMQPLEKFGLLDPSRAGEFESPLITAEEKSRLRETALRHIVQVAFAEIDFLRARNEGPVDDRQRQRLDQLVDAAIRIQADIPSRACLHVQAERARLAGDQSACTSLLEQADKADLQSDTELYLEAVRLMVYRRWPEARSLLTALADRGTVPSALRWTSLGRSQYHLHNYEDAKLSFTQSIEHAPKASRLWLLRGLCYYRTGFYDRAAKDFTEALTLEPSLYNAWSDRGLCRLYRDDVDDAINDFSVALAHSPGNAHVLLLRSRALRRAGQPAAADRDFSEAMQATNLSPSALISRSIAREENDPDGALADLEQAYTMDHGSPVLLQQMAHVLASRLHRYADAIKTLAEVSQFEPGNEKAIIDRAVLRARLGQREEALNDLREAIKPPNAPVVLYQAACVHALLSDATQQTVALGFLSKAIQAGYGADALANDSDLDSLREHEDFQSLLRTVELGDRVFRNQPREIPAVQLLPAP